jgi:non-ribosomal peptide synthetase component F
MGDLAKRISALSPEKLALLKSRLQRKRGNEPRNGITRQPRDRNAFPLSFAQERLWFLDQFQSGSAMYHIPAIYRFQGPLNVVALERSLNEIIRRHEILRTTFTVIEGRPVQVIARHESLPLTRMDLRGVDGPNREREVQRLIAQEAAAPFDLLRGPVLRTTLLELDDADHVLLLTMHHIVSDGWSMGVFVHELAELYDAYSAGRSSPLPELPIQYLDFAQWQRQLLRGEVLQRHLAYWKRQLDGAPTILELPTDRPPPTVQTFQGAVQAFSVSPRVTEALKALGRREGATLFMTLLAAFKTLLYRYSGQEDQVVGTLIANRNRMEIEGMIGFFVNTLALRTQLSGNPGFREVLTRVREVTLDGYAHQDLPFEKLVEELHPQRKASRHPLFQALFALQNIQTLPGDTGASAQTAPQYHSGTAKFDLALFMVETGQGLTGAFEYNIDLFDASTITGMGARLVTLLEGIAAHPEMPILDIPLGNADGRCPEQGWSPGLHNKFADDRFVFELLQSTQGPLP